MLLGHLYVHCIGLEKRMSKVLMMHARHTIYVKAKCDLGVLPPFYGAFELQTARAKYNQVKIWLQADYVIIDPENKPTETIC